MLALEPCTSLSPARGAAFKPPAAGPARARRRRALLKLALRHGEVRVQVQERGRALPSAADVVELLDELNETSQLRWGGLRKIGDGAEVVYFNTEE